MSACFFLFLIPCVPLIHASVVAFLVMIVVIGLPMITINVLLPFSRWETPSTADGSPTNREQSMDVSGGEADRGRRAFPLRAREMSRRRFKTVDGTSFRCEQRQSAILLNARPLLKVRLLKNGTVHLQTDDQQFLVDGATYWTMLFGDEIPTPMQAGLLLARLDELTDLLQAIVVEEASPRSEQAQE